MMEDIWQKKSKVYKKQLEDRLRDDATFKKSFIQTAEHVRAIHKLNLDYEKRRWIEQGMFIISIASIILVFLECSIDCNEIRIVNGILTILLLILLIQRYYIEINISIGKGTLPMDLRIWELPTSLILSFLMEFFLCVLSAPPGLYGEFNVNQWITRAQIDSNGTFYCKYSGTLVEDNCYLIYSYPYQVIGLLQLVRVYMVPRFVRNLSDFYSYRIAFIGSLNNVDSLGTLFSIKYLLRTRPFQFLSIAFLTALLTTACAVWILEWTVNEYVSTYSNAIWLTVVTMATVGYGDRVPMTLPGQIVMILFAMVLGILLTGMLSASFFAMLELTDADHNVFGLLAKENQAKTTSNASARLIQAAWNIHRCRTMKVDVATFQRASVLLYSTAQICRKLRKSKPLEIPSTQDQLHAHFANVREDLRADFAQRKARLLKLEKLLDSVDL